MYTNTHSAANPIVPVELWEFKTEGINDTKNRTNLNIRGAACVCACTVLACGVACALCKTEHH